MNYTTNYHLPQWVESDRIMMEDFNEAMSGIDGGIAAAKTAADTAKTTADAAQSNDCDAFLRQQFHLLLAQQQRLTRLPFF